MAMIGRRQFLETAAIGAASLALSKWLPMGRASMGRPNVILCMTDDQGYGDLSCHGNPIVKTPNLDRLHAQSVRFTDFHTCATCAPTRAGLMTGRYPIRFGMQRAVNRPFSKIGLPKHEQTLPELLAMAGYEHSIWSASGT